MSLRCRAVPTQWPLAHRPAMLSFLYRTLFWLAAAAAGLALLGPDRFATVLTAVAGVGLLLSYGAWRLALANERRAAHEDGDATEPAQLDELALLEIATRLSQAIAGSTGFDAALHAAADTLRAELGSRETTVHRVLAIEPPLAHLATLVEGQAGGIGVEHRVRLERSPLGEALRERRVAGAGLGPFAIPVLRAQAPVAVIELGPVALQAPTEALKSLFELTRLQLGRFHGAAAEPTRPIGDELLRSLPASVIVTDATDGRVMELSRQAEREFGLQRDALVGLTVAQAFGHAVQARVAPALAEAEVSDAPVSQEFELPSPQGTRVISAVHGALKAGEAAHLMLTVLRDVTEEWQRRRELIESQVRAREFAETVDDSLFVSNPDRSEFRFIASSAFDTWGVPRELIEREPGRIYDNVIEEDRPLLEARRQAELHQQSADVSVRIRHPSRGLRWLRTRTRTKPMPDGSMRVYGMVTDVTAERQRELDLERARDEAQAASQAKSQFMANMSHEIRTPMNGILGMTELLLGTSLDDRQRRFAQAVYRSGESLLEIINDILDFSKIEAGRLELAPVEFTVRSVVEDTLELLAPRAHEKGLELSFRAATGLPEVVRGDPLRLRQVLTNLVANAIKFTEHGEVVVDLRLGPHPQGEVPAGTLAFEFGVRDTGIGIEADVLPRLFNAFTQAHGGMSRRYGGTGLGLAISRQLVVLMGGHIEARSAPGLGSEFRFTLPLVALEGRAGLPDGLQADLAALRVLVVEDNPTNRTVLEHMLGDWGMQVTLAEDGVRALELLEAPGTGATPFDLALVDMHMPRLDGLGLARAIAASGRHPALKLVLLSSVSSPDDVQAAHDAGFLRFVAKPVRQAELRQALLGVTSSRREAPLPDTHVGRRVLVVEDNTVNQEVIGQMLRQLGCRAAVASGASEGLRALCEQSFDLVLMDIQMPGMDGVEVLRTFRRGPDARRAFLTRPDTPVVAVTANALDGDEQRFLDLGFDDYLSKPFRQSQLLAMLNHHLRPGAPLPGQDAPEAGSAPAAGAAMPAVLDAQALARLRELDPKGENRLIERVLKAFETSVARLAPQLDESRRSGDRAGIRHVAHTLKSSSASIGALVLSQRCAEVESLIRLESTEDLNAQLDALSAELAVVLKAIQTVLDNQA